MSKAETVSYDLKSTRTHKPDPRSTPRLVNVLCIWCHRNLSNLRFWTVLQSGATEGHAIRNPQIIHKKLITVKLKTNPINKHLRKGIISPLNSSNPDQFSFRCPPKFSNHINWHRIHTEVMKRICRRPSPDWLRRNDMSFLFRSGFFLLFWEFTFKYMWDPLQHSRAVIISFLNGLRAQIYIST